MIHKSPHLYSIARSLSTGRYGIFLYILQSRKDRRCLCLYYYASCEEACL